MELIKSYKDLLTVEAALQEQIDLTKHEIYEWYGVDADAGYLTVLGGRASFKMSMPTAVKQSEDRFIYLSRLEARVAAVRLKKERLLMFIDTVENLDHKIAYKRIIESKPHEEIAAELGYSHDYIRKRWSTLSKVHKHTTKVLDF